MNRWVVFDWGGVLSRWTESLGELAGLLGLPRQDFEPAYWAERAFYDLGGSDLEYWRAVGARLGVPVDEALAEKLTELDLRGWLHPNEDTLAVADELVAAGARLAVLSNAPVTFARVVECQPWAARFERMLFSGDLGMAKPDPRIYVELCGRLAMPPESCLFVDDRQENVVAARAAGLPAVRFSAAGSDNTLRAALVEHGFIARSGPASCP